jgi:hypothetical protein
MLTAVTETIAAQFARQVDVRGSRLIVLDDEAVRVSFAPVLDGDATVNVDIRYLPGIDLYTLDVHRLDRRTLEVTSEHYERVYCDQLGELAARGAGGLLDERLTGESFQPVCEVISFDIPDTVPLEWQ